MSGGEAFLDHARKGAVAELERALAADASVLEYRNELGQGAVLLAIYHRQAAAVAFLLARNPELTLHEAAAAGVLEGVRQRAEGAINTHSPDGFTPLSLAAFFGRQEVAAWLVEHGADVKLAANNRMGVAPLHAATAARQFWIARLLVTHGANVNARQQQGFTPLHGAAQNGDAETVKLLLEHGADREARSETGQSPLDLALAQGHGAVAALLEATPDNGPE